MLDSNCIFNPHYSHVVMFPKSCNFAFVYIYVLNKGENIDRSGVLATF